MTQGHFIKRSLTCLNTEFSFSYTSRLTKAKEASLPYYLPIAGGRIIGFITFLRVLVLSETLCLVQDLNSCNRVHFLRWYPLHHGHLQFYYTINGFVSITTLLVFARIIITLYHFSYQCQLTFFYWRLGDRKASQNSRTLLGIQKSSQYFSDFSKVLVWMVLAAPFSDSFSLQTKNLGTISPIA